jgi:hypothetical protein
LFDASFKKPSQAQKTTGAGRFRYRYTQILLRCTPQNFGRAPNLLWEILPPKKRQNTRPENHTASMRCENGKNGWQTEYRGDAFLTFQEE